LERQKEINILKQKITEFSQYAVQLYKDESGSNIDGFEVSTYIKDNSKIKWNNNIHFTKIYDEMVRKLMEQGKIDLLELGLITLLATYANYENNELMYEEKYMTQKDIIKVSGLGRSKVSLMLNNLIEQNILFVKKHPKDSRNNIYYLNPSLFFKGQNMSKEEKEFATNNKVNV